MATITSEKQYLRLTDKSTTTGTHGTAISDLSDLPITSLWPQAGHGWSLYCLHTAVVPHVLLLTLYCFWLLRLSFSLIKLQIRQENFKSWWLVRGGGGVLHVLERGGGGEKKSGGNARPGANHDNRGGGGSFLQGQLTVTYGTKSFVGYSCSRASIVVLVV